MKKIIAFSLWGDQPKYTVGAIKNADLAKEIYPDWTCRFYIGQSTPADIIETLKKKDNTEIVMMDDDGDWSGMFWRFSPCSESDVEAVLSRDTDSRLSWREKSAVDEWMSSDKGFHIIRDHPWHSAAILGGMWGCKRGVLDNMVEMMESYEQGDFWQVDQNFLRDHIYPLVYSDCMVHDEFFVAEANDVPKARENYEFIGEVFDENDNPVEAHKEVLKNYLTGNFS